MPNKAPEKKFKEEPKKEVLVIEVAAKPKLAKAKDAGLVLRFCNCRSAFQDKKYGDGKRVFTCGPKNGLHCTVCGARG
jgi:hypothetical protein